MQRKEVKTSLSPAELAGLSLSKLEQHEKEGKLVMNDIKTSINKIDNKIDRLSDKVESNGDIIKEEKQRNQSNWNRLSWLAASALVGLILSLLTYISRVI
jgi:septal ring factor EnvC (AmiA/AmiB activator)